MRGKKLIHVRLITRGFRGDGTPQRSILFIIISVAVAQAIAVFLGSLIDGTFILPNNGVGLLEHYGVWAILVTDPLLLILTALAYRKFNLVMEALPFSENFDAVRQTENSLKNYLEFLHMEGKSVYLYIFLVLVGILSWINNIRQTIDPLSIYGNDVFDAYQYTWGFIANKFNLFSSWVFVYPLVGFFLVSMSISTRLLLEKCISMNVLKPNILHPDGCYGLSSLGSLNISLLGPYLFTYLTIFALLSTHEDQYASIIAPLVLLTTIFIIVSFITISPITRIGKGAKRQAHERLTSKNKEIEHNEIEIDNRFSVERICYIYSSASPYTNSTRYVVNTMRITPIALTLYKIFF
uniref:Uncharacterized protein n=1 Tax=Candidatus Kentrum sp. FW TaxID=2126338 RepID=A0A450TDR3_9GAMM|nr:MAG: hypothetical protein BECKFW1821A_GA0114235_11922 [Candidatus Kentron sp. FW]